jgi:hypothetical protein
MDLAMNMKLECVEEKFCYLGEKIEAGGRLKKMYRLRTFRS